MLPLQLLQDVAELPQGLEGLLGLLDGELGRVVLVPLRTLVDRQGGAGVWGRGKSGDRQEVKLGQSVSLSLFLSLSQPVSLSLSLSPSIFCSLASLDESSEKILSVSRSQSMSSCRLANTELKTGRKEAAAQ